MPANHLESLVAEWYEFQGYFVRRNVQVGKREKGGYECALDIVGFHPERGLLVQVEPSLDAQSWDKRRDRYQKKFDAGRRFIPSLFPGLDISSNPQQIALFVYGGRGTGEIAGGPSCPHQGLHE